MMDYDENAIAIVGMNGRFPSADDIGAFWELLREGREGLRPLTEQELDRVSERQKSRPNYLPIHSAMNDMGHFAASFFDYSPREAEIMDPQQRVFLESCWHALEHAGYDPAQYDGSVGVFGGAATSSYLLHNLATNRAVLKSIDQGQIDIGNGADFLATRVSYKLNLMGPAFSVVTACSTSLVAVHLACQALLGEECDMAMAGGVALHPDHERGYLFEEGSILAPDGHCKPFDADAIGTIFAGGVGVVVLKRLPDAVADGDHIHAIIKASAISNDGSNRVGFPAPGVDGQAGAVAEALAVADVDPTTIQYVEAHGSGTTLGDPIEIRALTKAYQAYSDEKQFCRIGAVKSNIGHLTNAAGVAGLIKSVLSIEHGEMVPTLNYSRPNPQIDFPNTPFIPNDTLTKWEGAPRRAGVSSFGLGGTNVHIILEETPTLPQTDAPKDQHLLVWSAKTATALDTMTDNLLAHLRKTDDEIADIAYTLQVGRQGFNYRRAIVAGSLAEAIALIEDEKWEGSEIRGMSAETVTPSTETPAEIAQKWLAGVQVDWHAYHTGRRQRVVLPLYPFERERYWIEAGDSEPVAELFKKPDVRDWFYTPMWQSSQPLPPVHLTDEEHWLIVGDGEAVAERLRSLGQKVTVGTSAENVDHIIHLATFDGSAEFDQAQTNGYHTILQLARTHTPSTLTVISNHTLRVTDNDPLHPAKATLLGAIQVLPQEFGDMGCRLVDLDSFDPNAILTEATAPITDTIIAKRGSQRWTRTIHPTPLDESPTPLRQLRSDATYLITGGLSGIGFDLAQHIAQTVSPKLIIIDQTDPQAIQKLQSAGSEVVVCASIDEATDYFEQLDGLIHASNVSGEGGFRPITDITPTTANLQFQPKAHTLIALHEATQHLNLDFRLLTSAISTALGGVGFCTFTATAHFLDTFAQAHGYTSIGWDVWQLDDDIPLIGELAELALTPQDGGNVLNRILTSAQTHTLIISTGDLNLRIAQANTPTTDTLTQHGRPDLFTDYEAPRDDIEREVVTIWEQVLGISPIGIRDNFFDLGGHSLLATQLRNHIHEQFHIELPLRSLFDDATAAGVAKLVTDALAKSDEASRKPLKDRLAAVFPNERPAIMADYLRQKLATGLDIAADEMDADLTQYDLQLATVDLMWNIKRDLKLQLYPHEIIGRKTLPQLAGFILDQKDRLDNLPTLATDLPLSAYPIRDHRQQAKKRPRIASQNPSMVFLLSAPRSGSTLLRVMLAGHPDIFCPPEISLLFFEDMHEWQQNVSFGQDFQWPAEGLHWAFVELLGLETDEGWEYINRLIAGNPTVQEVYRQIQTGAAERLVIDKTPPYAMDPLTLQRAEEVFNQPKYIHLTRHPYAMMESFLRVRLDQQFSSSLFEAENPDPYIVSETIWATANRNLCNFFATVDPGRHHHIRYEDLVADPHTAMTALADFLGIPFDERLTTPYDGNRNRMMGGIGDPNILNHTGIDPKLGDVWKTITLPRNLDDDTKAIADKLGYQLNETAKLTKTAIQPEIKVDNLNDAEVEAMLAQLLETTP